ncbi:mrps-10 [Pristionchus pacificus]|uniref:Small ribosomal subunit protein uS10m n=1 Tax=Pristionchus pacificus TaxID=54126 RepID=A0A2A6BB07_PRIPA|nr:mrps-10 [Pristionchus pacificus]|eukprot:PDM63072.1 mrps-10 [Pristionchus pacificus]
MLRRLVTSGSRALLQVPAAAAAAAPAARGVRAAAAAPAAAPGKPVLPSQAHPLPDQLFRAIELEYRGHDPAVLKSYTQFLEQVCTNLSVTRGSVKVLPYVRWVQPLLRSKFVHKKYKLHYETRTHITRFTIHDVTGSTASTFLEYIERNIPEGVAMRVEYEELLPLPETITGSPYWKK